jgi:hypothetical protein
MTLSLRLFPSILADSVIIAEYGPNSARRGS